MIQPTVGRVVWFHPVRSETCAAIVAYVHSPRLVNLCVIDANGRTYPQTSVPLIQENEEIPQGNYCEWMPYQLGQAAKTESLEKQLAS